MTTIKDFKKVELPKANLCKLVGGNGDTNASEDVPITDLGTISNDGSI